MGQGVAARLVRSRHDVVVVDQNREVCESISARIGALAIHGSATSFDTLEDAGITKADVAVAAMPADADNLAFALLARNFDVSRVMARMRDPRYEKAYEMAGVVRTLNVPELFATRLTLEIEQPSLRQIASFGGGKAAIVVARIPEDSGVDGQTVSEIAKHHGFPTDCVIAGIFRESTDEFVIPRGAIELRAHDQVFLAAGIDSIRKAAEFLRKTK